MIMRVTIPLQYPPLVIGRLRSSWSTKKPGQRRFNGNSTICETGAPIGEGEGAVDVAWSDTRILLNDLLLTQRKSILASAKISFN
jgi:hypothetical protein